MKLIWLRLFYQQTVNYLNSTRDKCGKVLWKSSKKSPTLINPSGLTKIYQELTGDETEPRNESERQHRERIVEHLALNDEEGSNYSLKI